MIEEVLSRIEPAALFGGKVLLQRGRKTFCRSVKSMMLATLSPRSELIWT
jgi:hypothetical protein